MLIPAKLLIFLLGSLSPATLLFGQSVDTHHSFLNSEFISEV